MFCRNCGEEISDTAQFCPKCGYSIKNGEPEKKKAVEDNVVKFKLKPTFSVPYKTISALWDAIVWIFVISVLIINLPVLWVEFPITGLITFAIVAVYVAGKILLGKKQYENLDFNFYATKVEYVDGFLNKEEKELKYKYVREVTMTQSIIERMFNLGTIKIFTNASSGGNVNNRHNGMAGRNGVYIHCVSNVKEQYQTIKQIINEGVEE